MRETLHATLGSEAHWTTEYAEILDGATLEPFESKALDWNEGGVLVAVAGYVGSVRLIDNLWVPSPSEPPNLNRGVSSDNHRDP